MKHRLLIVFQKIALGWALGILILASTGCNRATTKSAPRTMVIVPKTASTMVYFNGPIEPISATNVISPVDGVIQRRYFTPGTAVAKDQLLFVINSSKLNDAYDTALITYIKALRDYSTSQVEMSGSEELKKYGIISNLDYLATKAKNQDASFAQQEALAKLMTIMHELHIPMSFLQILKTADMQSLSNILAQATPTIKIFSPATGIAIIPASAATPTGTTNSEEIGSLVKADEQLLSVGDMSGISIPIRVSETRIEQIKVGEKVWVRGDAFPNVVLNGKIYVKEHQPLPTYNSGTSTYAVYIIVPHLTEEQKKILRIGMSAEVKIPLIESSTINIPLTAVYKRGDQSFVKRINPANHAIEEVPVLTGLTSITSINILSGLNVGDVILVDSTGH